jgi:hypothetical protein
MLSSESDYVLKCFFPELASADDKQDLKTSEEDFPLEEVEEDI